MKYDAAIHKAMLWAINEKCDGIFAEFAKRAGISRAMPGRYIKEWNNGHSRDIPDDVYEGMWTVFHSALPDDEYYLPRRHLHHATVAAGSDPPRQRRDEPVLEYLQTGSAAIKQAAKLIEFLRVADDDLLADIEVEIEAVTNGVIAKLAAKHTEAG